MSLQCDASKGDLFIKFKDLYVNHLGSQNAEGRGRGVGANLLQSIGEAYHRQFMLGTVCEMIFTIGSCYKLLVKMLTIMTDGW